MNTASSFRVAALRASRRAATRRHVVVPCQAVREHDFKLIADRTLDVSVDGLLLPVAMPVLTGEALVVCFPIPGTWVDAEAVVTRVVHGRRPGDDGLAIGVTFTSVSPASRAALAAFLHGRPPPLPRRGPLSRLRRGEPPPALADQAAMTVALAPPSPDALVGSDDDVEDVGFGVDEAPSSAAATRPPLVDGASVVCALVGAWKRLAHAAD